MKLLINLFGKVLFLYFLYVIEPTICNVDTPDDGWVTIEPALTDHCYLRIPDAKTWQAANDDCISKNATLVSIHSNDENSFIKSLISGVGWTGLIKVHKGGQRGWSDATSYDYTNWRNGGEFI